MRYFDENIVANSRDHQTWWGEVSDQRNWFANEETRIAATIGNAAPILPRDAWMELDSDITRVMRDDEGEEFMSDLMPLASTISIGALVAMTRVASDAGVVVRSISGQVPVPLDKVGYDYRGSPVPIFMTGYGREWREWNTQQNANFDALRDDNEAHSLKLRSNMADYVLNGDANISVQGYKALGIMNHPLSKAINLGSAAGGANIDLTTATADQIEAFFSGAFGAMLDANKITSKVNVYISPEIGRALDRPYSGAAGFKDGTIWTQLLKNRRINKLAVTSKLTGNQFFGFVPSNQFIRPRVGMAANTIAKARQNPTDNYQFMIMAAMGIEIRGDWNQASGVFHSVDLD